MIILNLGFLYLDFINVYQASYSAGDEKYIQCFVIVFQESLAKNYVRKTIHLIAYLKKTLKPKFRYVITLKYFIF